jgi:hypothetical protein
MERLATLPDRALVMGKERMEFAYADGDEIYLVAYQPREGAPEDPTKVEWDVWLSVLDATSGAEVSPAPRMSTLTTYYDPSDAIQTPSAKTPAVQIMEHVADLCQRAKAWAQVLRDPTPIYEQLAII